LKNHFEDFLDAGNQAEWADQYDLHELSVRNARRDQIDLFAYLRIVTIDATCAELNAFRCARPT
jgi:hypothetical protein